MDELKRIQAQIAAWKKQDEEHKLFLDEPDLDPGAPIPLEELLDKIEAIAAKAERCHCGKLKSEPCRACGVFRLCPDHNEPSIYCYGCT